MRKGDYIKNDDNYSRYAVIVTLNKKVITVIYANGSEAKCGEARTKACIRDTSVKVKREIK